MYLVKLILLVSFWSCVLSNPVTRHNSLVTPRHVHLSYGDIPTQLVVTWSTINQTVESLVQFGQSSLSFATTGNWTLFVDGGHLRSRQYIHRVYLHDLKPGIQYIYRCGSSREGWSKVFTFRTLPTSEHWSPTFAVFGDMGVTNEHAMPYLIDEVKGRTIDAVLHVGDFAYDMSTDNAKVGDAFMEMIEPIAANIPYMTTVGNHEYAYNFSNYKNRFTMPTGYGGDKQGMFYSFDIGQIHFVAVSTEFYYYVNYGVDQLFRQYAWLEADLRRANQPQNRYYRPWVVLLGHRPMYCTNSEGTDCLLATWVLRDGYLGMCGMERLLYRYGVDVAVWAHEHTYERMWPVYKGKVLNGTTVAGRPYTDPRATVHVVTGSAGCKERHDPFGPPQHFSAFRSGDYGYSRMRAVNKTHLYFDQISTDQKGKIIDRMMIVKNLHGAFT